MNLTEAARVAPGVNQFIDNGSGRASVVRQAPTLGFTDCGHNDWRDGVVLIVEWGTDLAGKGSDG